MKFLASHRNKVFAIIEKHGFDKTRFEWIKRKGRIIAKFSDSQFSYFRKKETFLDQNKRWVESEFYLVSVDNSKEYQVEDWDHVLLEFEKWIAELS